MDDDQLRGATDERFGIELGLFGDGEFTAEPLLEEGTQRRLFAERGSEAA